MKTKFASLLILIFSATTASQAEPEKESAEPTRPEVESYVKQMQGYLKNREESAARIVNEIVELDHSLKNSVNDVLQQLSVVTDSENSKTKVARMKRDVMERIGKAAKYYVNERAKLDEALRTTSNTFRREDLYKERAQFGTRIDAMVNAVMKLAATMDTHQDFEEYLYENNDSWGWGWGWGTTVRKNPEFEQNRRATTQTDTARKDIDKVIQQSKDRLQARKTDLESQLKSGKLDAEQQKRVQTEVERLSQIGKERAEQLDSLQSSGPQPTAEINLSSAMRMEEMIQAKAADARRDIGRIFARYRELRTERDVIADQEARLTRAEQWLKDHPAAK